MATATTTPTIVSPSPTGIAATLSAYYDLRNRVIAYFKTNPDTAPSKGVRPGDIATMEVVGEDLEVTGTFWSWGSPNDFEATIPIANL